jgi:hypothetical protein
VIQALLFLLGGTAIYLVGRTGPGRRYGYLLGLCAQPFWLWESWRAQQWGIFALSLWYTLAWGLGLRNNWRVS